ncbi:MAG: MFS transporter [Alphaproteobacteria bacterium]|nr:MFS transporter [Alphaproteobacteria bacterium]
MSVQEERSSHKGLAWFVWFLATVFFAYQFILRLAPGLIINEMMSKYNISATEYGVFSAMYYVGYAGCQIPVALLLDRYGTRIVGALCIILCAMSSIIFMYTDSWSVALVCRLLIGAGSAAGFLTVSKVISMWFEKKYYGRMVSITFSFGLIGAVYGGRPISNFIDIFGWFDVMVGIGIVGLIISVLFLLFSKPVPGYKEEVDLKIFEKLSEVCANKKIIWIALGNLLLVGALEGFADVWGVSYLVDMYEYSKQDAATITSFIFVGMIFGAPLLAILAEKMNANYSLTVASGIFMGLAFFMIILLRQYISTSLIYVLVFLIGVACCYQVLVFTIGSSLVKTQLIGVTIAFLNSINMLGGTFFHSVIGFVMDHFWTGETLNGAKVYGAESYNYSLISIPIASVLGAIIFLVLGIVVARKTKKLKDPSVVEYH